MVVEAYEIEPDGSISDTTKELLTMDISYSIPNITRTQVEITIPAIYAIDNYSEYNNLLLSRVIIDDSGNTYSLDGSLILNVNEYTAPKIVQSKVNEEAKVFFRTKGNYTIRYRAIDQFNNSKELYYKIVVNDVFEDNIAPYICLPTITGQAKIGDTITFNEPIIIDYKYENGYSSSEIVDNNVKSDIYYWYGEATLYTDFSALLNNNQLTKLTNQEGLYIIKVAENVSSDSLVIVVRAEDDARYATGQLENNVSFAYKNIKIDTSYLNDDITPNLLTDLNSWNLDGMYGQNELVYLPELLFSDNNSELEDISKYLSVSLTAYDKNRNMLKLSGFRFAYSELGLEVYDARFITTTAGLYEIVITAYDYSCNYLVNSYKFYVNDSKSPTITIDTIPTFMELGKKYILPTPVVYDDGEIIVNQASSCIEFGENCPNYSLNAGTLEFTPKEKGTYTLRFVGKDYSEHIAYSDWFTITVADTIKPVIIVKETELYTIPETAPYKDGNNNVLNISLPLFTAVDEYNGISSTNITVTNSNGDEIEVIREDDHYEFTPTGNGIYTVTYKAVDLAGNSTTQTYSIKVGDVTPPEIVVQNELIPTVMEIGDECEIPNIKVIDNGQEIENKASKVIVFDDNCLIYEFDNLTRIFKPLQAGTFSFYYVAKDNAGNESNSQVFIITCQDTTSPAFDNYDWKKIYSMEYLDEQNSIYKPIEIPYINAFDLSDVETYNVEVKYNDFLLNVNKKQNGNYEFTPNNIGVYKFTYTAIDYCGNSSKIEYYSIIGDDIKPTINYDIPTRLNLINSLASLKIDLASIFISDNISFSLDNTSDKRINALLLKEMKSITNDNLFNLEIKNSNGQIIDCDENDVYNFMSIGVYKIKIVVSDFAGNKTIVEKDLSIEHSFSNWIEEVASTCEINGTKGHYHCIDCDKDFDIDEETIIEDLKLPLAEHTWGDEWHFNKEGHYKICEVCGAHNTIIPHKFDDDKDENCNICGYERLIVEEQTDNYSINISIDKIEIGINIIDVFKEASENEKSVSINIGLTNVTFDVEASRQLSTNENSKFSVTYGNKDEYENCLMVLNLLLDNLPFNNGKAKIEQSLNNFEIPENKIVKIYYLNGNEKIDMKANYSHNKVSFETNHFSTYLVVLEDKPITNTALIITLTVSIPLVTIALLFVIYKMHSKNKKIKELQIKLNTKNKK